MTWKAIAPVEVCDVMAFLESQAWPLERSELHRVAIERFGWATKEHRGKEQLLNAAADLTIPNVVTIDAGGEMMYVELRATDVIREITDESLKFLDDAFALLVREGESRWGVATISRDADEQRASWRTPHDARIRFAASQKSITVGYDTPQRIDLERRERRFA